VVCNIRELHPRLWILRPFRALASNEAWAAISVGCTHGYGCYALSGLWFYGVNFKVFGIEYTLLDVGFEPKIME